MSITEKRLGSKITELRLSKGLTQAQLAEKVGVTVETISRLERGVSVPSINTLENIARSLNVPLKKFFELDGEPAMDQSFERELAKLIAFLRTCKCSKKEIKAIHGILKATCNGFRRAEGDSIQAAEIRTPSHKKPAGRRSYPEEETD